MLNIFSKQLGLLYAKWNTGNYIKHFCTINNQIECRFCLMYNVIESRLFKVIFSDTGPNLAKLCKRRRVFARARANFKGTINQEK